MTQYFKVFKIFLHGKKTQQPIIKLWYIRIVKKERRSICEEKTNAFDFVERCVCPRWAGSGL